MNPLANANWPDLVLFPRATLGLLGLSAPFIVFALSVGITPVLIETVDSKGCWSRFRLIVANLLILLAVAVFACAVSPAGFLAVKGSRDLFLEIFGGAMMFGIILRPSRPPGSESTKQGWGVLLFVPLLFVFVAFLNSDVKTTEFKLLVCKAFFFGFWAIRTTGDLRLYPKLPHFRQDVPSGSL